MVIVPSSKRGRLVAGVSVPEVFRIGGARTFSTAEGVRLIGGGCTSGKGESEAAENDECEDGSFPFHDMLLMRVRKRDFGHVIFWCSNGVRLAEGSIVLAISYSARFHGLRVLSAWLPAREQASGRRRREQSPRIATNVLFGR